MNALTRIAVKWIKKHTDEGICRTANLYVYTPEEETEITAKERERNQVIISNGIKIIDIYENQKEEQLWVCPF